MNEEPLYREIWAYAYKTFKNPSLADDFCQETFCRFYGVSNVINKRAVLFKILRNLIKDYRKSFPVRFNVSINIDNAQQVRFTDYCKFEDNEASKKYVYKNYITIEEDTHFDDKDEVQWLLQNLSDKERQIITMKYYDKYSDTEIAEKFGCQPSSISMRFTRIRNKLRKKVGVAA